MRKLQLQYVSLGLLKFPDIVKLNTCLLFYDYFNNDKLPTLSLSLVSDLHNYNTRSASSNQLFITSFRTNLRTFCPTVIEIFFGITFPRQLRINLLKECLERHSITITLINIDTFLNRLTIHYSYYISFIFFSVFLLPSFLFFSILISFFTK